MIRSFHRIGGDLEVDAAFETLRGPLDELKEMKIEEWGTSEDEIEASDSEALTQAQSQAEDVAALDAIEEDDPQAPRRQTVQHSRASPRTSIHNRKRHQRYGVSISLFLQFLTILLKAV
jgi:hypothetical protein